MQSFPTGGYYPASAPGTSKHRIVILNTVFFSTDYRNQCGDPKDDPGDDQLRWLAAQLQDAANKGNKVWLLYHIPYGIDAYNSVIAPGGNAVEKVVSLWQPITRRSSWPCSINTETLFSPCWPAIRTWITFDWDLTV